MTAWLIFGALAIILLIAAWFAKMPKGGVTMVTTAMALAAAGYATQGQPSLAASPAEAVANEEGELAAALIDLRDLMDRNFGPHMAWLTMSDAALRRGDYPMAVAAIEGGLKQNPGNDELLNARAMVLFLAADANLTPAVALAFQKAKASQWHPGPYYFEGLAHLSDRKPELTLPLWQTAMTRGTPKGEWRVPVQAQLDALTNMMAQNEVAEAAQTAAQEGVAQP
jgi:cytochrome c-type biogenesis protein CcmH